MHSPTQLDCKFNTIKKLLSGNIFDPTPLDVFILYLIE